MILFDAKIPVSLTEYGIQIPISDSRTQGTFAHLTQHPFLGPLKDQWHLDTILEAVTREDLLRAHDPAYVDRLFSGDLQSELIKTYELVDDQGRYHRYAPQTASAPLTDLFARILLKIGGTVQTARLALETGFGFHFGGGMHHARRDTGSGFCLLNDIVIAIRKLQAEKQIRQAWVIDLDAHKGDGTAAITVHDPSITTLSIHMAQGWPLDEPPCRDDQGNLLAPFIPSDIDIPIAAGEEDCYNPQLAQGLVDLTQLSRPDLAVVLLGADPLDEDELPSTAPLKMPLADLLERDMMVYHFLQQRRIPSAWLMAGGYGKHVWQVFAQFLEAVLVDRLG